MRPQPLVRRDRNVNPTSGSHKPVSGTKEFAGVFDMLDHIEQANRRKGLRQHARVFQGGPHYLTDTAFDRVLNACKPRFHEDDFEARLLDGKRNASIAAANIKERAGGWEQLHDFQDATVSVLEPERRFFHRKA